MMLHIDAWTTPDVLCAKRVTEAMEADLRKNFLVRAEVIDLDPRRGRRNNMDRVNTLDMGSVLVATGEVKVDASHSNIIFAGGSVRFRCGGAHGLLIVSGGDVELDCALGSSLVIARGAITYEPGYIGGCRFISGKSVTMDVKTRALNIITENEKNPLGFIRWAGPPNEEKGATKRK